jgi:phosphoesterase RecJ-like protein
MTNSQSTIQIYKTIASSKFPLIISHENPDGDTLGASLALTYHLANIGIKHKHYCINQPADYFSFLPGIEKIITNVKQLDLKDHDLIIAIDCGSIQRTGLSEFFKKNGHDFVIINIDHHHSNNNYGHHNLVIPTASSTSEIMFKFFKANDAEVDKYIATALLMGILSDTMNFTNAATTEDSLQIASELLKKGARTSQILNNLMQNKNLLALKLWGTILSRTEIHPEYNFAYTIITSQDFNLAQINRDDIDGLANFLSTLQDVDFIIVISEEEDETIKGSLRTTKDIIDVAKIAQAFGGGGHKKAAGFKIEKKIMDNALGWKNFVITGIINELNKANC